MENNDTKEVPTDDLEEEVEEDEQEDEEKPKGKDSEDGDEASEEKGLKKKLASQMRKESNRFKRLKEAVMDKVMFMVALCLIALFVIPTVGGKVFDFLSGVETVVVESKAIVDNCYQVTVTEGSSYCVDEVSYEKATVGVTYHLDEYDYYHILREVREWK